MALVNRVQFILDRCRGKHVVHIGCADWPYTKERLQAGVLLHAAVAGVAESLCGVDLSPEGIRFLESSYPEWELHLTDATSFVPTNACDVILLAETLEHLENPGKLLTHLASWSGRDTRLVITVPNAYSLKGALRGLMGREYCHPDHVVHFSGVTLKQLLVRTGWLPTNMHNYESISKTFSRRVPSMFAHMVHRLSPTVADGLVCVAKPVL